jgi:hypothetical protein
MERDLRARWLGMRLCRRIFISAFGEDRHRLRRSRSIFTLVLVHGNGRRMKRLEDSVVTTERDLKLLCEILERI